MYHGYSWFLDRNAHLLTERNNMVELITTYQS